MSVFGGQNPWPVKEENLGKKYREKVEKKKTKKGGQSELVKR